MKFALPHLHLGGKPVLREKILFGLALVSAFALFSSYILSDKTNEIKSLKGELKGVEAEAESISQLIEATEQQLAKEATGQQKVFQIDDRIKRILNRKVADPTEEVNKTVHLLGERKIAHRVTIKQVSMGERRREGKFIVVPVTIDLTGRYSGIQGYLASLERIERPIIVRNFAIKDNPDTPGLLQASILVYLYILEG